MVQNKNNARGIYDVEAEVHKEVGNGFRVKVSILDFGFEIGALRSAAATDLTLPT